MDFTDIGLALGRGVQGGYGAYQVDQKRKDDAAKEAAQNAIEEKRLEVQQMLAKVADDRYQQGRKDDAAQQVAGTLDPWSEVDPKTASALKGTPYEGRISSRATLPSKSGDPFSPDTATEDPGGEPYQVWTPTTSEMRSIRDKHETDSDRDAARADAKAARSAALDDRRAARSEADVDHERERTESFDDWKKREDYTRAHPSAAAGSKDDPEMPRGVEDYLYKLSRRPKATFEDARTEVDATWSQLKRDHPSLSRAKVNSALRGFFQADPKVAATVPLADIGVQPNTPAPPARSGGPGPVAASVGGAPAAQPQQPRTVTAAQVAAVAAKNGTTPEQERKRAEAEGFVVR